jgi:hypothetical protein
MMCAPDARNSSLGQTATRNSGYSPSRQISFQLVPFDNPTPVAIETCSAPPLRLAKAAGFGHGKYQFIPQLLIRLIFR